jgi:hypothetical protein
MFGLCIFSMIASSVMRHFQSGLTRWLRPWSLIQDHRRPHDQIALSDIFAVAREQHHIIAVLVKLAAIAVKLHLLHPVRTFGGYRFWVGMHGSNA